MDQETGRTTPTDQPITVQTVPPRVERARRPFGPVNMGNLAPQQLDFYTQATQATPAATFGQPPPPALPQAQQQNQQ